MTLRQAGAVHLNGPVCDCVLTMRPEDPAGVWLPQTTFEMDFRECYGYHRFPKSRKDGMLIGYDRVASVTSAKPTAGTLAAGVPAF